jgi:hypothetical protein
MADTPERVGLQVKSARQQRGWSQVRLVSELRRHAQAGGQVLPSDASVKRRIASWENGHSVPEGFYGLLLSEALDLGPAELGLSAGNGKDAALLEVRYPPSPAAAITAVDQLWRADLHGYEPLVGSQPSEPAWSDASLRWLVAPEPAGVTTSPRSGPLVGITDVAVIKSTNDAFATLDDQFGGEHARRAVIQYLAAMWPRFSTLVMQTMWDARCSRPSQRQRSSPDGCRTTHANTASLSGTSSRHYASPRTAESADSPAASFRP